MRAEYEQFEVNTLDETSPHTEVLGTNYTICPSIYPGRLNTVNSGIPQAIPGVPSDPLLKAPEIFLDLRGHTFS